MRDRQLQITVIGAGAVAYTHPATPDLLAAVAPRAADHFVIGPNGCQLLRRHCHCHCGGKALYRFVFIARTHIPYILRSRT